MPEQASILIGKGSESILNDSISIYLRHKDHTDDSILIKDVYYTELSDLIKHKFNYFENETVSNFFSINNKKNEDNIDFLIFFGYIKMKNSEKLWHVDFIDNQWFAVNLKAKWCPFKEIYKF